MRGGGDAGPLPDAGHDAGLPFGCPAGTCNLVGQVGCFPDEACYFVSSGGAAHEPVCLSIDSFGTDGDPCTAHTDCAEGFGCEPGEGVCRAYCCGGSHLGCPSGQNCAITIDDPDGSPTDAGFCAPPPGCDPVEQTGCSAGQACFAVSDGSTRCLTPGDLVEGDTCEFANDCVAGLACYRVSSTDSCHRYCDTTDGSTCGAGQTCESLGYPRLTELGLCVPAGA